MCPDDLVGVGAGGDDLERLAVRELDGPLVGGLASAARIEAGAVERQLAVAHRDHARVGLEAVIRLEVEARGPDRGATSYAGCDDGAYLWPSASSHRR
jgi:hypothetical protein